MFEVSIAHITFNIIIAQAYSIILYCLIFKTHLNTNFSFNLK